MQSANRQGRGYVISRKSAAGKSPHHGKVIIFYSVILRLLRGLRDRGRNMALARTGNVNSNELYTFFTNDTNAFNNIVSISGQVINMDTLTESGANTK